MADKKKKDDQSPRGADLEEGQIRLDESIPRLQRAECIARGGQWRSGKCFR